MEIHDAEGMTLFRQPYAFHFGTCSCRITDSPVRLGGVAKFQLATIPQEKYYSCASSPVPSSIFSAASKS